MPELPEVETVRRVLAPVMLHARIADVELRRPDLRIPLPPDFRARLTDQEVLDVSRRAKYLLVRLSSGDTLLMHLGMSGSFHVATRDGRTGEDGTSRADHHDHVVFHLSSGAAVTFNDPRRFGFMDVVSAGDLAAHPVLSRLGPEPLSPAFDGAALARACRGRKTSIKVALLDQRVVAGVGNIYAGEALHAACLSPFRRASTIATTGGAPRESADRLADGIRRVLTRAIKRLARRHYRSGEFRVYDREGAPCPRRSCTGRIRRRTQAGRSTFYCSVCQR